MLMRHLKDVLKFSTEAFGGASVMNFGPWTMPTWFAGQPHTAACHVELSVDYVCHCLRLCTSQKSDIAFVIIIIGRGCG